MNLFKKKKLDILVLGTDGMLGYDVYQSLMEWARCGHYFNNITGLDRKQLDKLHITDYNQNRLYEYLEQSRHFDYIINCVAMTDTYAAENTVEGRDLSYKLNTLFPKQLAVQCKIIKSKLIHISTDYVFSEKSPSYSKDFTKQFGFFTYDTPYPVNTYGHHKLLGEQFIQQTLKEKDYAILRTSLLYGQHNQKSFVHKFLNNAFKCMDKVEDIEVTENEYSIPTSTHTVVEYIIDTMINKHHGIIHAVCATNDNQPVSIYDFAKHIGKYYNQIINDRHPESNKRRIEEDAIVPVIRENKLQPVVSRLYRNKDAFYWKTQLYTFMLNNFEELSKDR